MSEAIINEQLFEAAWGVLLVTRKYLDKRIEAGTVSEDMEEVHDAMIAFMKVHDETAPYNTD